MFAIYLMKNPKYVYVLAFVLRKPLVSCLVSEKWIRKLTSKVKGNGGSLDTS